MRLFWCYGTERLNAYINRWIHDRAQPLTNLVNAYRSRRVVDYLPPESIASCRTQAKDFPGLTETMDRLVADTEVPSGVSIMVDLADVPYACPRSPCPLQLSPTWHRPKVELARECATRTSSLAVSISNLSWKRDSGLYLSTHSYT